jgi:uncharacterized membrane protein YcaP (DUF421 family)
MPKDFHVFDFHRIFFGDLPPVFLFEVVFRTVILYSYTLVLLRLLGKRGMGQLSTLEVAIIISFGSAIGDSMTNADMPISYGMIGITVVAIFQIYLERLINKNKKVEAFMEGEPRLMVEDGIIMWPCLVDENLSKEDLFRFLRDKEVEHLGQVHKALFEISGNVSVMFQSPKKVKPGLTVLPENNISKKAVLQEGQEVPENAHYSCLNCGYTIPLTKKDQFAKCVNCNTDQWIKSQE